MAEKYREKMRAAQQQPAVLELEPELEPEAEPESESEIELEPEVMEEEIVAAIEE
jgi:hypothetical protein